MSKHLIYLICWLSILAEARPYCHLQTFEDMPDITANVSRIVQDKVGYIWLSTPNGLYRFDGYEFANFKPDARNVAGLVSNKMRNIYYGPGDEIWCQMGDGNVLTFNTLTHRFENVTLRLQQAGKRVEIKKTRPLVNGCTWLVANDNALYMVSSARGGRHTKRMLRAGGNEIEDVKPGADGQSWILTRREAYVYNNASRRFSRINMAFGGTEICGGQTWLLSSAGRLFTYDPRRNRVRMVAVPATRSRISEIKAVRGHDMLLLAAGSELLLMNTRSGKTARLQLPDAIGKLKQTADGDVYLLTASHKLFAVTGAGRLLPIPGISAADLHVHKDNCATTWIITKQKEIFYREAGSPEFSRYDGGEPLQSYLSNSITDACGNLWFTDENSLNRLTFGLHAYQPLPLPAGMHLRASFTDSKGRIWLTGKTDGIVALLDARRQLLGWLAPGGEVQGSQTSFGANVYSITQDSRGNIWLGTRENGIFVLTEQQPLRFGIRNYRNSPGDGRSLSDDKVYDMVEDPLHRMWIATFRGGLDCVENLGATDLRFTHINKVSDQFGERPAINDLLLTKGGCLLIGTDRGLWAADIRQRCLARMSIRRHVPERDREASLGSGYINSMAETAGRRVFICFNGSGIDEITSADLLAHTLSFRHMSKGNGFPSDFPMSITAQGDRLWTTTRKRLIETVPAGGDAYTHNSYLRDEHLDLSECLPLLLKDGRMILGLTDGAIEVNPLLLHRKGTQAPVAITRATIHGRRAAGDTAIGDTITLSPGENSLLLSFSALDFTNLQQVEYAWRISGTDDDWHHTGSVNNISLAGLQPGEYLLQIKSTDGTGRWTGSVRQVLIVVKPTFGQTIWARLLAILLVAAVAAVIWLLLRNIRNLKKKQHAVTEMYLRQISLAERKAIIRREEERKAAEKSSVVDLTDEDKLFMEKLTEFVNRNLGNSEVSFDGMAAAVGTSRSGLTRIMRRLTGLAPMEFMRKAQMQKARELLRHSSLNVQQVAFDCGFSDPKYFSKTFKSVYGETPSSFRKKH